MGGGSVTLPALVLALSLCFCTGCDINGDSDAGANSGGGSSGDDTVTAATAETITASELAGTTWSYTSSGTYASYDENGNVLESGTYTITRTLDFKSGGKVAVAVFEYENDEEVDNSSDDTYTYSVNDSTVTIYDDDGDEWGKLIRVSGKLVQVGDAITPVGSSASGSSTSLAGTTWTSDEFTDEDGKTNYTEIIEFLSDGKIAYSRYKNGELERAYTELFTYNVDGYTVTIYAEGQEYNQWLYFDGKLVVIRGIYTKDS